MPHGTFDPEVADHLYQESAGNPFYLQEVISGLVEAATINAGEGEIRYKIGSLLNAQM